MRATLPEVLLMAAFLRCLKFMQIPAEHISMEINPTFTSEKDISYIRSQVDLTYFLIQL